MHILFLTDNFPPEVNAPASRTFEHTREWVKAGQRVTVITCAPNFPKGRVFAGYRNRLWQSEEMDGIRVIRVWTYITANEGFLRRILDYLSFMFAAILAAPWVRGVDVVVGTSPQFFTACAAYLVSRMKRVPFVFELRDLWPESIKAVGAMSDSAAIRMLERIELFLYRKAVLIVSVTNAFKRKLVERGVEAEKIAVVTNGVDLSRFVNNGKDSELSRQLGLSGCFVLGYIGTHGLAHGLETILDAAEMTAKRPGGEDIRFLLLGDGARKEELMGLAAERRLKNVVFHDSVPKDQVVRYWSLLDASIIHLKASDLFKTVIPSKIFESMAMGLPILHGVSGESAEIISNEEVGILFESGNPEALCKAIEQLRNSPEAYQQMQKNCLISAQKYDRKTLAKKMLTLLTGSKLFP